ncbi:FAD binding domain-containing protein [Ostreiculturibacter nitratireducens]|uniref:FAD binding domain-containing protein n=1 Tax=Ostreiculturibacter nitratireducens TaxID=3075226 RepID=UPI0031B5B305
MIAEFASPDSEAALMALLATKADPGLIAGGTDLLIASGNLPAAQVVVDLGRIPSFRQVKLAEDALFVGAGVTVAAIARDPLVARHCPVLGQAAVNFGSVQIRNRATIGGNVANGSPAADLPPALVAARAEAVLRAPEGETSLPVADLLSRRPIVGRRQVIVGFRLPLGDGSGIGAFVKLGRRQEPTISCLTLAAAGPRGALRLVAGAIGPAPRRLAGAEAALNAGADGFLPALEDDVLAAIPGRASAAYKSRAIRALGLDLLDRITKASEDAQ